MKYRTFLISFISFIFIIGLTSAVKIDYGDNPSVTTNLYFINATQVFHNNLSDLQGGSSNEYYHLNQSTHDYLVTNLWSFLTSSTPRWIVDPFSNYLYNDTDTIYFNETRLNETIDLRAITSEVDPLWNGNSSNISRIGNCPSGQVVQNTTTNGVECITMTGGGGYWILNGNDIYNNNTGIVNVTTNLSVTNRIFLKNSTYQIYVNDTGDIFIG